MVDETLTEARLKERVEENPNLGVPLYLCAAYAYYVKDAAFMSDASWEWLARFLLRHWDAVQHPHKALISTDDLRAGTYLGTYPEIVKDAAADIQKRLAAHGKKKPRKKPRKEPKDAPQASFEFGENPL